MPAKEIFEKLGYTIICDNDVVRTYFNKEKPVSIAINKIFETTIVYGHLYKLSDDEKDAVRLQKEEWKIESSCHILEKKLKALDARIWWNNNGENK